MSLAHVSTAASASTRRSLPPLADALEREALKPRMPVRHVLMLLLALELLAFGFGNADRYRRPPVATVDPPSVPGHVIT